MARITSDRNIMRFPVVGTDRHSIVTHLELIAIQLLRKELCHDCYDVTNLNKIVAMAI